MDHLIFELYTEVKELSRTSFSRIPHCRCHVGGRTFVTSGYGALICRMARMVVKEFGTDFTVTVKREGEVVFDEVPITRWSGVSVSEGNNSAKFVRHEEWWEDKEDTND